ncbi:hypothetical protein COY27_05425 [Candidatus Woesearchaeota archaeon CG_4_10_14_0_2_um_filter_33_13]|nr:MAG: hypothetical protein COY27_05425 [Candidatus Woesearchaeota archaeon CG_4_10_14_0_2_um_filter_33_13]
MKRLTNIIVLTLIFALCWSFLVTAFSVLDIAPKGFVYEQPKTINSEVAKAAIQQAELDIAEMQKFNFITVLPSDALTEAKQAYSDKDYEQAIKLCQLINYIKKEKVDFFDRVKLLEVKKQALTEKGVEDVTQVNILMQQAMNAFNLEQLDEAEALLNAADTKANELNKEHLRVSTIALLSKNFVVRYWWQTILALILLSFGAYYSGKLLRRVYLKRKTNHLKLEMEKIKDLIKQLQKECFIDKKMSTTQYKESSAKYEERINEIKRTIPVLEAEVKRDKPKLVKKMKMIEKVKKVKTKKK